MRLGTSRDDGVTTTRGFHHGLLGSQSKDCDTHSTLHQGNRVEIEHGDGTIAYYAHLQSGTLNVREGQPVDRGEAIGRSGMSGMTLYPHLHFAVADEQGRAVGVSFRDVDEQDGIPRFLRAYQAHPDLVR